MRISDWSSDVCSSDLHLYRPTTSHTLTVDLIRSLRGCNTTPPRSPPWRTYPPHHPSSRRHHLRAPSSAGQSCPTPRSSSPSSRPCCIPLRGFRRNWRAQQRSTEIGRASCREGVCHDG